MNGKSSVDSASREKGSGYTSRGPPRTATLARSPQRLRRYRQGGPRPTLTQTTPHLVAVMFTDYSYNKPWLATWLCTSSFSLYLIRPALHAWRRKRRRRRGSLAPLPFLDTLARVVSKDDDDEDDEIPE